jgi:type IV pilus assembly protein PilA
MKNRSKGFTLIELMVVVAIVALLSAIATVRFARSQARSKQAEATANLKAMFVGQKAFSAEKGQFSDKVAEIGFSPERNNRYAYFVGASANLSDRTAAAEVPTPPGGIDTGVMYDAFKYADPVLFVPATLNTVPAIICTGGTVPGLGSVGTTTIWTGAAQGQIDTDTAVDNWSISTDNRTLGGTCDASGPNPAGEPANEHNDVNQSM